MRPKTLKYGGRHVVMALACVLVLVMSGCATPQKAAPPAQPAAATAPAQPKIRVISDIMTTEDDATINVLISGDSALAYTSVRQPNPPGVVLYLPSARLQGIPAMMPIDNAVISSIKTSEITGTNTTTARVQISLKGEAEYDVRREGNDLKIRFEKSTAMTESMAPVEAAAPTPVPATAGDDAGGASVSDAAMLAPARQFTGASAVVGDDGVSVKLAADGAISEYDAFTLATGDPRIVLDLFGLSSNQKGEQIVPVNTDAVRRVRYFSYPDKVRVVIDTQNNYLNQYQIQTVKDGMTITVGAPGTATITEAKQAVPAPRPLPAVPAGTAAGEPAWVNRVDFSSEKDGRSTVIIGTTRPVKYVMNTDGDQKLLLSLFDTNLPGYRQRPLITTRFESAIDRILPVQTAAMKDKSIIGIELREAVPYTIEQLDDLIMLHFDPSRVPPRPLQQAGLPEWQEAVAAIGADAAGAAGAPAAATAAAPAAAAPAAAEDSRAASVEDAGLYDDQRTYHRDVARKYTGEKIALDFYETDIKNVFRILREVSGKNYAIDKDVAGRVTLSLEKPVPWDQVLDLVLRMNQLGMVYEGDIVRIATLTSIKQEEELRKEALRQALEAKTNEKLLAPVETGYFPINYADAGRDILPHVQALLSKGRDDVSVTVFEPTNQLIVVDTREKLADVADMVKKLDRVTDQVLIEARVVEATATFRREFGTNFSAGTGSTGALKVPGKMTGNYDLNMAWSPALNANAGQFTLGYTKIGGTPLTINAQLNLLESQGETKIISSPKILTLDNKPATIKQGTSYPINKLDADGNSTTEFKDIVLELTVTPHVTKDGRISLKISVTKNDLGAQVGNNFSFDVNEANTELIVDDGDTIVIGGITKTTDTTGEEGIPGLKELPMLGWLFKTANVDNQKRELLIFLTPRIVKFEE